MHSVLPPYSQWLETRDGPNPPIQKSAVVTDLDFRWHKFGMLFLKRCSDGVCVFFCHQAQRNEAEKKCKADW